MQGTVSLKRCSLAIALAAVVSTRYLAGGNIQLHKPNPSTTGPSVPPDEIMACGSDDSGLGF